MFNLESRSEEKRREMWYPSLGEYIVLFSNLEFSSYEWVDLVADSNVVANKIKNLPYKKRVERLIDLIGEYEVDNNIKDKWKILWKKSIKLSKNRNLIAHNPPFKNFQIDFDRENKMVVVGNKQEEIHRLNKPVGEPGSGLSLEKIKQDCIELRSIIIDLDKEHTGEILRY